MTSPIRKRRGREAERLVAQTFAADGWPYAEAVGPGRSGRDVTGVPGIAVEVKARRDFEPMAALRQATKEAKGDLPVVIVRPYGGGPTNIDAWPAVLTFGELRKLLRSAGYGQPSGAYETAVGVLVAHQRLDITGCLCGWSELGQSHAKHQVAMLVEAGLDIVERES